MEIFVFGSNTEGRHGKGAALTARLKYGAIYGQSSGLQGNSYAIITKDLSKGLRSVDLKFIEKQVKEFLEFAKNSEHTFIVSKIGCGLGGYNPNEIAPFFKNSPPNVILPNEFKDNTEGQIN